MRYPILPAGAFTAAFLVLVPAFWNWRSRNVPTLSLIVWLFTLSVIYGVNSLVWSDNVWDTAPVWCDISAKLIIGSSTALPACTLCICKYLAMIGGNRTVGLDRRDRRRIAIFDLIFCWGIPVAFMALHYIVQGHRYKIVQYIGCQPTTYISIPGILIVWLPPLLLSAGTFVYAGIALYHLVQMRVVFTSVLQVSDSPMSTNQYVRLIAMSATLMLWDTIMTSLTIWANTIPGLLPWVGWKNIHSNWDRIDAYVWLLMAPRSRTFALLFWWTIPVSSIIFFVFLGFGEDAVKEYKKVGKFIINAVPSGFLPRRSEKLGKGMLLPLPGSSKYLPRSSNSSCAGSQTTCVTEKHLNLKPFILPLPALSKTTAASRPTISSPSSLNSLEPSQPIARSRLAESTLYPNPTASNPMLSQPEIARFSASNEHLVFGQAGGPSTPLSANAQARDQAFQELPPIQSLQSLHSMVGISHSRVQSKSSVKSNERRWSARSEKLRPPPLQLDNREGRLCEPVSG